MTTLAASRLTSHSQGPGSVSSKSLASKTSVRSGEANSPKLLRWASPLAWTRMSVRGRGPEVERHHGRGPAVVGERRLSHPLVADGNEVLEPLCLLAGQDRDRVAAGGGFEGGVVSLAGPACGPPCRPRTARSGGPRVEPSRWRPGPGDPPATRRRTRWGPRGPESSCETVVRSLLVRSLRMSSDLKPTGSTASISGVRDGRSILPFGGRTRSRRSASALPRWRLPPKGRMWPARDTAYGANVRVASHAVDVPGRSSQAQPRIPCARETVRRRATDASTARSRGIDVTDQRRRPRRRRPPTPTTPSSCRPGATSKVSSPRAPSLLKGPMRSSSPASRTRPWR